MKTLPGGDTGQGWRRNAASGRGFPLARSSKKLTNAQAARRSYVFKVRRLQRAGLLKNIDPNKKPTPAVFGQFTKHRDLLTGRATALKAPTNEQARELRKRLGVKGSGKYLIVPREKGERIRITSTSRIRSTRERYGQTITKEIGGKIEPPKTGDKFYYTIPYRRRGLGILKRHTFSSFDEMLFYLTKYEIDFEDIEDYIEVEQVHSGSSEDEKLRSKYVRERKAAFKSYKKKYAKHHKGKR